MRNLLLATTAVALLSLSGPAGAQPAGQGQAGQGQANQNQPQQMQSGQQQSGQQTPAKPGGADIAVQQKPAEVTVQQPAPQVTVTQPQPQVTIDQPKPEVTVSQPKPDVTVQQAKPEVTVNQSGKPDVTVVPGNSGRSGDATQPSGASGRSDPLAAGPAAMTADQAERLIGRDVVSSGGQDMGEVNNLIVDGKGRIQAAVVQWGGFLGIGDKERVVPWNQVRYDHANNRAVIDMAADQIKALPEYDERSSLADMGADARPLR